jgi:hypothetical protein
MTKHEWEGFVGRINRLAGDAKNFEDPAAPIKTLARTDSYIEILDILLDEDNGIAVVEPVHMPSRRNEYAGEASRRNKAETAEYEALWAETAEYEALWADDAEDETPSDKSADEKTSPHVEGAKDEAPPNFSVQARGLIWAWDDEKDGPRITGVDEIILLEDLAKALKAYLSAQDENAPTEFFDFFCRRLGRIPFGMLKNLLRKERLPERRTHEMRVFAKIGRFVHKLQEETGQNAVTILGNLSDERYERLGRMFLRGERVPTRKTLEKYIRVYLMKLHSSLDKRGEDGVPFNEHRAIQYANSLKSKWETDEISAEVFRKSREEELQRIVEAFSRLLLGNPRRNANLVVLRAVTTRQIVQGMAYYEIFSLKEENYLDMRNVLAWHTQDADARESVLALRLSCGSGGDSIEITIDPGELNLYCNYPELFETFLSCTMFAEGRIPLQKELAAMLGMKSEATITNNVKIVRTVMRTVYEMRGEADLLSAYAQ